MAGPLKPPFAYYGGKMILAPKIAELLPPHDHYVEPFAGSLSVLLAKDPSRAETVNDLDGDLMTFWRVLRDRPDDLERAAALTPHSREEYMLAREELPTDDLERARRIWVRLTQGRNHSLRGKSGGWKYGFAGRRQYEFTGRLARYSERIPECANRLRMASLESRDAIDVIRDYGAEPNVCIYADPPYLGSLRAEGYRLEMLEDDLHIKLADALRNCKASVVLSGYASPLYEELYPGWHRMELKAPTALSGRAAENEVLWSNIPLGIQQAFDFGEIA